VKYVDLIVEMRSGNKEEFQRRLNTFSRFELLDCLILIHEMEYNVIEWIVEFKIALESDKDDNA
jgi:hypothetical protein